MIRTLHSMRTVVLLLLCTIGISHAHAQETENKSYHFNGHWSATNNGFSFIPTFSLGKPATIVNLNVGGDRFTWEPQFRFDLDGFRPWSIIGFWRYKIVNNETFMVRVGTQLPAYAFHYESATSGTTTYTKIVAQRFLPFDFTTNWTLTDKVTLSVFYLTSFGVEKADQLERANFVSVQAFISKVKISDKIEFAWNPQVYYLGIDGLEGYYTAHSFTLKHADIPVDISSTINKAFTSELNAKNFDWNVSLGYTFGGTFTKQ